MTSYIGTQPTIGAYSKLDDISSTFLKRGPPTLT